MRVSSKQWEQNASVANRLIFNESLIQQIYISASNFLLGILFCVSMPFFSPSSMKSHGQVLGTRFEWWFFSHSLCHFFSDFFSFFSIFFPSFNATKYLGWYLLPTKYFPFKDAINCIIVKMAWVFVRSHEIISSEYYNFICNPRWIVRIVCTPVPCCKNIKKSMFIIKKPRKFFEEKRWGNPS